MRNRLSGDQEPLAPRWQAGNDVWPIFFRILARGLTLHLLPTKASGILLIVISPGAHLRYLLARPGAGLRAIFCLMAVSFLLAGLPAGDLHAHAAGEHGHSHAVMPQGGEPSPVPGDEGPTVLHFHEAASLAQDLPARVSPVLLRLPPVAMGTALPAPGPRLTPRPPPHRPPIA